MAAADGYPELGLDGLCNIPVGAALAEADGGDPVAGDLEFEVGVGAAVSRTGYSEAVSGDPDVGQDGQLACSPMVRILGSSENRRAASASVGERQMAGVQSPSVIRSDGQYDTSPQPSSSGPRRARGLKPFALNSEPSSALPSASPCRVWTRSSAWMMTLHGFPERRALPPAAF